MKRIRRSADESAPNKQLRTLAHNLNSDWGLIHSTVVLACQQLPSPDQELYEEIRGRALVRLQETLTQLSLCTELRPRLSSTTSLLNQFQSNPSATLLEAINPALTQLNQLLNQALNKPQRILDCKGLGRVN